MGNSSRQRRCSCQQQRCFYTNYEYLVRYKSDLWIDTRFRLVFHEKKIPKYLVGKYIWDGTRKPVTKHMLRYPTNVLV